VAFALAVLWLRYAALPHIDDYRGRIFSSIGKASGMAVSARRIEGGWEGLRPHLSLQGFEIADPHGRVAVAFDRAEVTLSWWALLRGRVRFHDVDFYRPLLELHRGLDGRLYLADQALDPAGGGGDDAFTQWLLSQPRLGIHDATLVWRDDLSGAAEVRLTDVQIALRQRLGAHRAALSARPPRSLAARIDLRCDLRVARGSGRYTATGEVYGETRDADLAALRTYLPLPDTLRSGVGNLRVWGKLGERGVDRLVADLRMRDARAQLDTDAQPLDLETLSGRAVYEAKDDGYSVTTRDLRFRLPGAAETSPGNFSLMRQAPRGRPPHVEIGADGIDLKIAATLLEYLPVPRELRAQVVRFAPRGRLEDGSFSWSGEDASHMKAYALHGRFRDVSVNAVDRWPGATHITGRIEGTQTGGTIEVDSRDVTFDLPATFREPLAFDSMQARADWKSGAGGLAVDVKSLRFANADAAGEASGTWQAAPRSQEHGPGSVDIKGRLERFQGVRVASYLPNMLSVTRDWVERAVKAGDASNVRFEVRGDLSGFPWGEGKDGRFLVEADVKGAQLKYLPDWPSVDAIDGTLRFENRTVDIRAARASIYSGRAGPVSAVIADLGVHPARLAVDGDMELTGADGMRFLRESPLANGPGAITRAVSVDGPAHLKLHLDIPLGAGGDPLRVAGDVQLEGDTARAGNSLVMHEMKGHLGFTERAVRAQDITGTLFDEPARLAIATQPDGVVATTLEGRADASTMASYAPAFVAPRIAGAVAWRARMLSGGGANELTITSDLRGLAVALPAPLAKDADTPRPVTLTIANLGTERESTRVLLDGGIHARLARAGERWNAAVGFGAPLAEGPLRQGLWLYGQLPDLDVDAWRALFPAPQASAAPPQGGMDLNGLDLQLARLRFLGHDFAAMHASLERKAGAWDGHVDSASVAGDVHWDPAGHGRVTGRLEHFALNESAPSTGPGGATARAATDLPAIDVTAKRFDFRGHWLGELTLDAQPDGDQWRIDRLDIVNDHARFHSKGLWRRTGAGSLTSLSLKLDADDLSLLLKQFGYGDYVRRGSGALQGELVWNGYPHEFALAALAGTMHVEAKRGQFAKIPTGAGKLLGLLSLQSLPRRALFDFRDIFGDGFAFERIQGDVKVARGVLLADDFEISGPAAFVSLSGEVSLPLETQALTLRVIPEVSEGVALAATVFGTPVLGLGTLVLSKLLRNPLGKVVAYEYRVTGSWDNPVVERLSAPARPAGNSASAGGSATAETKPE
jgi:uncharacterized protein (TIGR02099 family)